MNHFKKNSALSLTMLSLIKLLLASLLLVSSVLVTALPDDSNQPISIIADTAIKDDKLGLTIYEGNVSITQGSLNILADKVTIFIQEQQVTKMVAIGTPASFKQKPNLGEKDVIAKADTIDYFIIDKKITLTENASLDQDGSTLTGKVINYDINGANAKAEGGVKVVMLPAKTAPVKTDTDVIDTQAIKNKKTGNQ
jgi:lipopolysaccharide export system protein LptA